MELVILLAIFPVTPCGRLARRAIPALAPLAGHPPDHSAINTPSLLFADKGACSHARLRSEPRPSGSRLVGIVKSLFGSGYAGLGSGCANTYDAVFSDSRRARAKAIRLLHWPSERSVASIKRRIYAETRRGWSDPEVVRTTPRRNHAQSARLVFSGVQSAIDR